MYKIFINDKPFFISNIDLKEDALRKCKREKYDPAKLLALIKDCEGMSCKGYLIIHEDIDAVFKDLYTHHVPVVASGGVVYNQVGHLLLIKRLGKWDLPKGKIDAGESSEEAAIREVEEECGISGISIIEQLPTTYHTYKMHNYRFLKITNWYRMKTEFKGELVPQKEEMITDAKWIEPRILDLSMLETYDSIRDLLSGL